MASLKDMTVGNWEKVKGFKRTPSINYAEAIRKHIPYYRDKNISEVNRQLEEVEKTIPYRHTFIDTMNNCYMLEYNLNGLCNQQIRNWMEMELNPQNAAEIVLPLIRMRKSKKMLHPVWGDLPPVSEIREDLKDARMIELYQVAKYAKLPKVIKL